MLSRLSSRRLALLGLAVLAWTATPSAQTQRLSAEFERNGVVGDVRDFRLHPGGTQVLFRADVRREGNLELYRVPLDGSTRPVPVIALPNDRSVERYEFSPNGRWLVYLSNQGDTRRIELYSHEVGVRGARRLNEPFEEPYRGVQGFRISRAGAHVAFESNGELFGVPIDGSTVPVLLAEVGLNGIHYAAAARERFVFLQPDGALSSARADGVGGPRLLSAGLRFETMALSPDGETVVGLANGVGDSRLDLYAVAVEGLTPPLLLDPDCERDRTGLELFFSPGGTRAVYRTSRDELEIYSVPLVGGVPRKLDDSPTPGQVVTLIDVSESGRLLYGWRQGPHPIQLTKKLCSVPVDGSAAPVVLAGPETISHVTPAISSDSSSVVFIRGPDLTRVPLTGGALQELDDDGGGTARFWITPDSSQVVFEWGGTTKDLFRVPISGQAPPLRIADGEPTVLEVTPDSACAVYLGDSRLPGVVELQVVNLTGAPESQRKSAELAYGYTGDVAGFVVDPTGARAAYVADASVDGRFDLFVVPTNGSETARRLDTGVLADLTTLLISADGRRAVYLQGSEPIFTVRSVELDGSSSPVSLGTSERFSPVLAPDGSRAVFRQGSDLVCVPITGGPPTVLASSVGIAWGVAITSDSAHAVFGGSAGSGLFCVPLTGGVPPLVLDPSGPLGAFELTPDGQRVVYQLDPSSQGSVWSALLDGSAPPVRLSGTLSARPDLALSPDGQWVVLQAWQLSWIELYSRRVDGSGPLVRLQGTSFGSVTVPRVLFHPDSSQVFYDVRRDSPRWNELFVVPIDASSPPRNLSAPAISSVSRDFELAFGGSQVIFRDERFLQLYRAPSDGSAPPTRIAPRSAANQWAGDFALDAATGILAYLEGHATRLDELEALSLDGRIPPQRVSPPLASPGCTALQLLPGGQRVLYLAAVTSHKIELFASELGALPLRHTRRP